MKTTEEIFIETKAIFAAQAAEALEAVMEKLYTEYLPHIESDTQSNVYFQTCDWIQRFFGGRLTDDEARMFDVCEYSSKEARQKIYEANKEEIQAAIGRDLQMKIDSLKDQLNAAYRRY